MKKSVLSGLAICLALLLQVNYLRSQIPSGQKVDDRSAVKCYEDSPERRGEEGCTILANRPLLGPIKGAVYWHIDRFNSLEDAKKAAGPNGVAAEAHGGVWLMTVEGETREHHGGRHVALIGPLILPAAKGYTVNVRSTLLKQGASTPVHKHSGPEVFYIVLGEQCLETEKAGHRLVAGKSLILATDLVHRGRVQKAGMRGALTLVLHDSKLPASRDLNDDPPPLKPCYGTAHKRTDEIQRVDHLVYATPDLDRGIAEIEQLLGVRATFGGKHPGRGTKNAFIALGPNSFLEIVAPDPDQPPPNEPRPFFKSLTESRLVRWFINSRDIRRLRDEAVSKGVSYGEVKPGSRQRPDGVQVSWMFTDPAKPVADGVVPFIIDWGDSPHPSQSAAKGATLIGLRAEHPNPRYAKRMLRALGLELSVKKAEDPALIATIEGPRGRVTLK